MWNTIAKGKVRLSALFKIKLNPEISVTKWIPGPAVKEKADAAAQKEKAAQQAKEEEAIAAESSEEKK